MELSSLVQYLDDVGSGEVVDLLSLTIERMPWKPLVTMYRVPCSSCDHTIHV